MKGIVTISGAILLSIGCLLIWDKYLFRDIWDEVFEREDFAKQEHSVPQNLVQKEKKCQLNY